MVGGSGLYVEAVLGEYRIANVPENARLRHQLMQRDHAELLRELARLDPDLYRRTDLHSKKRVVRALEIERHARNGPLRYSGPPPVELDYRVFAVEVSRAELFRRIDVRLEQRLSQGLVAEVEGLLAGGVGADRLKLLGLEYREVTAFLLGEKSEREMIDDLRQAIRRFAKRQLGWFRGSPRRGIEIEWIGPDDHEAVLRAAS